MAEHLSINQAIIEDISKIEDMLLVTVNWMKHDNLDNLVRCMSDYLNTGYFSSLFDTFLGIFQFNIKVIKK